MTENKALAYLLTEGVCFLNNIDMHSVHPKFYEEGSYTTCVFVLCSDTFYYATADAECIENNDDEPGSEIIELYNLYKEMGYYGVVKWVALRRKRKPIKQVIDYMKEKGYWTEELENII